MINSLDLADQIDGRHEGVAHDLRGPHDLVLLRNVPRAQTGEPLTPAVILIGPEDESILQGSGCSYIVVSNPSLAMIRACRAHFPDVDQEHEPGIHPSAVVHPTAKVHPDASIGPHCVIGPDCSVWSGSVLDAHVTLYARTIIGGRVHIHAGVIVGARGFNLGTTETGWRIEAPSYGGVVIEDAVEIGPGTTVQRGSLHDTVIKQCAKVDAQCHIGHDSEIGSCALVCAKSMIGGYVRIDESAFISPSSTIRNRVTIGEHAFVGIGSLVTKDVSPHARVAGSPARPVEDLKALVSLWREMISGTR